MKASTRASGPAAGTPSRTRSRSRSPVWWVIARRSPEAASRGAACHHGHVDRVRALRTAKDQHPCRIARSACDHSPPRSAPEKLGSHRVAGHKPRAREVRATPLEIHRRGAHDARQQPIGDARQRVLLEQHRRIAAQRREREHRPRRRSHRRRRPRRAAASRSRATRRSPRSAAAATRATVSIRDLPFSPATRIRSSAKPSRGTTRASMPCAVPTNDTCVDGSRRCSSRASAMPG